MCCWIVKFDSRDAAGVGPAGEDADPLRGASHLAAARG